MKRLPENDPRGSSYCRLSRNFWCAPEMLIVTLFRPLLTEGLCGTGFQSAGCIPRLLTSSTNSEGGACQERTRLFPERAIDRLGCAWILATNTSSGPPAKAERSALVIGKFPEAV